MAVLLQSTRQAQLSVWLKIWGGGGGEGELPCISTGRAPLAHRTSGSGAHPPCKTMPTSHPQPATTRLRAQRSYSLLTPFPLPRRHLLEEQQGGHISAMVLLLWGSHINLWKCPPNCYPEQLHPSSALRPATPSFVCSFSWYSRGII